VAKVDLHVHSEYSKHPSEWFLKKIGASESYTKVDHIYNTAMERGMDFVTITDHNDITGSLILNEKYPLNTFTGVETTTYFPEDNCKIHILIFGFTESQFDFINKIRNNIYDLRSYIINEELPYSVAHATFSINNKLKLEHLEKLILLFDVFEGINGARNLTHNQTWIDILSYLEPYNIEHLFRKYKIEPLPYSPWKKSFTGGSDDHSGLYCGTTYTICDAATPKHFLNNILNKKSTFGGRNNTFQDFVFTIYNIAFQYTKSNKIESENFFSNINSYLFANKKISIIDKYKISKLSKELNSKIADTVVSLIEECSEIDINKDVEKRTAIIYDKISNVTDEYLGKIVSSIGKNIKKVNFFKISRDVGSIITLLFMISPFFSSFNHLNKNRKILEELKRNFKFSKRKKKILWFTDTIDDLNGVSVTLKTIDKISERKGLPLKIISSLNSEERENSRLSSNIILIPEVYSFPLPYYPDIKIKIPSFLKALKIVDQLNPDEIYISTPGPVGMLGVIISRLLNIKSIGVFHTDFASEISYISEKEDLSQLIETLLVKFYSLMSFAAVPSHEYIEFLEKRGIPKSKLTKFNRGIETDVFYPKKSFLELQKRKKVSLLYVGRVSMDKNIDFAIKVFMELQRRYKDIEFKIVGAGPNLEEFKKRYKDVDNLIFKGKVEYNKLPDIYSDADFLIFPSLTETFGMVVLEAQACGVCSIVSDVGGPKEIIDNGKTGFSLPTQNYDDWVNLISQLIEEKRYNPENYIKFREEARRRVLEYYNWDNIIEQMFQESNNFIEVEESKSLLENILYAIN